ncbi:hypothetical protein OUZ56_007393 [Daphnia magna]|uniref:Uncharacterized protein n=1 Tax=Daphnia magna TaxID=35525 RepID=A0ABR0A9U5_9CRUS|nr:hypothetical protein OUZ56_007393 [Daphnia magna]
MPVQHANENVITAAKEDKEFCLYVTESDELALKKNHSYYSQIQFQMMVCQVNLCFFIVYTKLLIIAKSLPILPELIGKFYTETRYRIQSNVDNASQLPATNTVVENEEDGVNEDICRSVSITLEKKVVPVDSSNVVASRHTIKDIDLEKT